MRFGLICTVYFQTRHNLHLATGRLLVPLSKSILPVQLQSPTPWFITMVCNIRISVQNISGSGVWTMLEYSVCNKLICIDIPLSVEPVASRAPISLLSFTLLASSRACFKPWNAWLVSLATQTVRSAPLHLPYVFAERLHRCVACLS